ncbi:MAG: hypothetical protein HY673_27310 [Chloroflexi bacterium]|nr:hypothetical protein [Chloroflexota bacterium]
MALKISAEAELRYISLLVQSIRVCGLYKPKFGQGGKGVELAEFSRLYGADPFYPWVGLDSPLIYAAHKAAGGMTSIYRQLGIGCERLFSALLQDCLGLSAAQARWEYRLPRTGGGERVLKLDGRIDVGDVQGADTRNRVRKWLQGFMARLDVQSEIRGSVFEVRQGYKSKDSKRQNADLANAASAYTQRYLPVLLVMSLQLDSDIRIRYEAAKWGVLAGDAKSQDPYSSTYSFCRTVLGFDLASFLERNSERLRTEVALVVRSLLEP